MPPHCDTLDVPVVTVVQLERETDGDIEANRVFVSAHW
jgi:hypothetical protein